MDHHAILAVCRSQPGATEGYPFGAGALVFKVADKMFAIVDDVSVSLKCDPGLAIALRESYAAVTAGYHLDKRHWNTVQLDGSVPDDVLTEWVEESHALVVAGLPKSKRAVIPGRGAI